MKSLFSVFLILTTLFLVGCSGGDGTPDRPDFNNPPTDTNPFDPNDPDACVAVDTDGDGLINCKDPDIDNDGRLNEEDVFPLNSAEWADTDGDGVGDNSDWDPNDPQEQQDSDNDDIGDFSDPDDDNDGVPDTMDAFDFDNLEWFDIDLDNLGQENTDPDSDNDGVPNNWDDVQFDRRGGFDIDSDLLPNILDDDLDGDTVVNALDSFVYDNQEWADTDFDRIGNNADPDDDNDSIPDPWDDFPEINRTQFDSDNDGFANRDDIFPYDPTEWEDTDGDGFGDNSDAFPSSPFEWKDNDQDGVGDNSDPDIDGDGLFNPIFKEVCEAVTPLGERACNSPKIPWTKDLRPLTNPLLQPQPVDANWQCEGNDANNDMITDNVRCNSLPGCQWVATAAGTPEDPNCKSIPEEQICQWNSSLNLCTTKDDQQHLAYIFCRQNQNNTDCENVDGCQWQGTECIPFDFFSYDDRESEDLDRDKLGDGEDPDDDNDGFPDQWDQFPRRADAWLDFDNDNIFDWIVPQNESEVYAITPNPSGMPTDAQKADPDSDNDGTPDRWDDFAWDPVEWADIDGDGLGANIDQDDDGDGVVDNLDSCPIEINGLIINLCQYDSTESADTDEDSLGNNLDIDDDNDGVPDVWDAFSLNTLGYSDYTQNGVPDQVAIDIDGDFTTNGDLECATVGPVTTCSYPNTEDAFIWDEREQEDFEGDGLGNNEDPDDDNDGTPDHWDDQNDDGVVFFDIDNDGEGADVDFDIDGDGIENSEDAFPFDGDESVDTDGDNFGNDLDFDDDGDGVPDFWDDLALDSNGWFDVDNDGIDNRLDLLTPFGVRNQAELLIALTNNEQAGLTADFEIDQCISVPAGARIFSAIEFNTITYTGPDDNCIFNIEGAEVSISNFVLIFEETTNVTAFTTTAPQESVSIRKIDFRMKGTDNMIADMTINDVFGFTMNNVLLEIENDRALGRNSLININTPDTNPALVKTFGFGGNLIFLDFKVDQTNEFIFVKINDTFRQLLISSNAISLQADDGVTVPSSSAFVSADFSFGGDANESNVLVNDNRINQNYGRFLDIISSDLSIDSTNARGQFNGIFGITSLGNPFFETFVSETSGEVEPSYIEYYDFTQQDTFLAPERGQYAMFYLPNQDLLDNSPGIYPNVSDFGDIQIIEGYNSPDNLGQVNFIGVYPPTPDTDGDRYADYEDVFPFDETEWEDTDNDGIGDNTDIDDDNDNLLDDDEVLNGTDPKDPDTDDDGLTDFEEVNAFNTDPTNPDTDGDGDTDSEEISNGTDPNDPLSSKDTDGDGLTDNYERDNFVGCTDPELTQDSDGDGLNDFEEDQTYNTNPCSNDTDNDGLLDFEEINTYSTDPNDTDSDSDGRIDGEEVLNINSDPNWVPTNPTNPDTDADGSTDGQEILDGTNPADDSDFKDSDLDGESDYVDKTPYGVWPCTNTDLASCDTITPDNSQLVAEFALQFQQSNSCANHTTSGTCIDPVKDLCQWNSTDNICEAKTMVVRENITLDRCFVATGEVNLRGLEPSRPQIIIPSSLNSSPSCSLATSGVFHGGNNQSRITVDNLRFESDDIQHIISSRGEVFVNNSEFYGLRRDGTAFILGENNPSSSPSIVIEKSTFRSNMTNLSPQNPVMSAIQVDKSTLLEIRGTAVECDIKSHVFSLNNRFSCMDTVSDELFVQGLVVVSDGATFGPTSNVYSWSHRVNSGGIAESRLSRLYSNSKTLNLENNGTFTIQGASGLRVRDASSSTNTTVSGNAVSGSFGSLPIDPTYQGSFVDTESGEYACVSGNDADAAGLHPYYFPELPASEFFYVIDRGSDDPVQVPGAERSLTCP